MIKPDLPAPAEFSRSCHCLNAQRRARGLARRYDAAFRPVGLTSGQFAILAALNRPEGIALGVLADLLGLERTTLTRNLARLEAAALVRSATDDGDQRLRRLGLSEAGRTRLEQAAPLWRTVQASIDSSP